MYVSLRYANTFAKISLDSVGVSYNVSTDHAYLGNTTLKDEIQLTCVQRVIDE